MPSAQVAPVASAAPVASIAPVASGDAPALADAARDSGVRVAVADGLVCAVRAGRVYCWGGALRGRPRGDAAAGGPRPVLVRGVEGAVDVTAGVSFACALLGDGSITCWGDNDVGQLGDGRHELAGGRGVVTLAHAARNVSAGEMHACAAAIDGRVWCWGTNRFGQLGDRTYGDRYIPVAVAGVTNAVRAVAGRMRSCAELRSGRVTCWGGTPSGARKDVSPHVVGGLPRGRGLAMSSWDQPCILAAGAPHCAPGPTSADTLTLGKIAGVEDGVSLSAGGPGGCVVRATGQVVCWESALVPEPVPGLGAAERTAQGNGFGCAVRRGGAVACWGSAGEGVLGDGTVGRVTEPARVRGIDGVATSLVVGQHHTCALVAAGLLCWGSDGNRELGGVGNTDHATAVSAVLASGGRGTSLVAGFGYTCTLQAQTLRCWGRFVSEGASSREAREIARGIVSAAAGGDSLCVVRASGRVACAQVSGYQYADVTLTDVPSLGVATAVTVASQAVCALDARGAVTCLGLPDRGPVRDRPMLVPETTFRVPSLTDVAEIALAEGTLFARTRSGAALAVNLLENRALSSSPSLATTSFGIDAIAISAGGDAMCAVRATGAVMCRPEPPGSRELWRTFDIGASSIAVSATHACAALRAGGVACWGDTMYGQLGDGTVGYRPHAADVKFP